MDIDPDLLSVMDSSTLNGDYSFVDLDTLRDKQGKTYRVAGFDAPEIAKILGKNEDGGVNFKQGTAGGAASIDLMKLAKEQGFTDVKVLDQQAAHGRGTVQLLNAKGEDFATRLIETGVADLHPASTQKQIDAYNVAQLFGEQIIKDGDEELKEGGQALLESMLSEGYDRLNFKRAATNEEEYAYNKDMFSSNVQFRSTDRDLNNKALSPLTDSWNTAMQGVKEAGFGIAHMFGDSTGLEDIADWGEHGAARVRGRIMENAEILTDYKDVKSFSTAMDFLGNNLAMSLPYMAITMVSVAAAAPTGGASLTVPASIYAGQVYNEQAADNKSAAAAIASGVVQGALDMVGLKLATKFTGNTPKEFFEQGVAKLMNAEGISKSMAEAKLAGLTRRQVAGLAKDSAKLAASQLTAKKTFNDLALKAIQGGMGEGVTEALQESIAYAGANFDGTGWDWEDLKERAIGAAVAGGSLGMGMSTAGTIYDKGQWADVAWRLAPADLKNRSEAEAMFREEVGVYGSEEMVPTTIDIAEDARRKANNRGTGFWEDETKTGLKARFEANENNKKGRTLVDQALNAMTKVGKVFKGHLHHTLPIDKQSKYRSIRKLAGMFGAGIQKVYEGAAFENYRHHVATKYINRIPKADKFYKLFGEGGSEFTNYSEPGSKIYNIISNAMENGKFNPDLVPDSVPQKQLILSLVSDLRAVGKEMHTDQSKFNPDLGYIEDYLLKFKGFNKSVISKNKASFIERLTRVDGGNISRDQAVQITEAILGSDQVNTLDEAFDVVERGTVPTAHKKRTLGLSERAEFQDFMEQDIMANVITAAKSAARYQAHEQYVGDNGKVIEELLREAEAEGMPKDQADYIGAQMYNYLQADSGNYHRPTSDEGKQAAEVQKNFIFFTTITSLSLAALSSLPEAMITMKGLTVDQIFGKDKNSVKSRGQELAKELHKVIKSEKFDIDEYEAAKLMGNYAYQQADNVGMFDPDISTASKVGVSEIIPAKQNLIKLYFRMTGLTQYTDWTRAVRASFGADFMLNHINTILEAEGQPITNEVQEAREMLRNIGMTVAPGKLKLIQEMLAADPETLSPEQAAELTDMIRDPLYNFINEAIANPQTGNRPLFYQDPRFALFTQFQGFMSTFTANHIPKFWQQYIKRGSPAMKYNAFAVMTGMIMMGFASQYLKDLLKYGESTPYLDNAELIRRGVQSSGLMGTMERITSTVAPIYESRSKNAGEWLYNEVSGQSPAISKAGMAVGTGIDLLKGDTEGLGKGTAKLFSIPTQGFNKALDAWDFKGGS